MSTNKYRSDQEPGSSYPNQMIAVDDVDKPLGTLHPSKTVKVGQLTAETNRLDMEAEILMKEIYKLEDMLTPILRVGDPETPSEGNELVMVPIAERISVVANRLHRLTLIIDSIQNRIEV